VVVTTDDAVSKKTMLVERTRVHYARSHGDPEHVCVDEPLRIDLELPASYARDLLDALRRVLEAGGEFDRALLSIDVPIRLYLRPTQVEQLVDKLALIVEESSR
jgi:hypothetical protein